MARRDDGFCRISFAVVMECVTVPTQCTGSETASTGASGLERLAATDTSGQLHQLFEFE